MTFAVTNWPRATCRRGSTVTTRSAKTAIASGELLEFGDSERHGRPSGDMTDEFNALTDVPCKRLCYVGADSFLEGQRCGEVMGELLGGKGQVLISTGNPHGGRLGTQAQGISMRRSGINFPTSKSSTSSRI